MLASQTVTKHTVSPTLPRVETASAPTSVALAVFFAKYTGKDDVRLTAETR